MPAAGIAPSGMVPEADVEKKLQRFKEIFKKKVATFKEAVYLLTGYKVRLVSVFACAVHLRH